MQPFTDQKLIAKKYIVILAIQNRVIFFDLQILQTN